jgi:1-acyl-sn-glycerol-3-phosphate acyltransferase
MIFIRSVVFSIVLLIWSIPVGILFLPILLLPARYSLYWGGWWSGTALWLAKVICGIRWQVTGLENLPEGAVIFAAKHQSAWDTLFFPAFFLNATPIAKSELRFIPLYGWYAWRAGAIWIDRKTGGAALRKMIKGTRKALALGRPVFVFPQGTRTLPGEVQPYQSGVTALYAATDAPVVPVALNSGQCWGRRAFVKRAGLITVELLPPLAPDLSRPDFLRALEEAIEPAAKRLEGEPLNTPKD